MDRWEYCINYIGICDNNIGGEDNDSLINQESELDKYGFDGWELVQLINGFGVFKRKLFMET